MDRRTFLTTATCATGLLAHNVALGSSQPKPKLDAWDEVRKLFDNLDWSYLHLAGMLLTSHPRPVREAIEGHRAALDRNPALVVHERISLQDQRVRTAAAQYLGGTAGQIALTDSTTMGLGLLYSGLRLGAHDEVLSTTHDHYSTQRALAHAAARSGATVRTIKLYDSPTDVPQLNADALVAQIVREVRPSTRVLALTWVHSGSGLKMPIAALAEALRPINALRAPAERVLLCIDGVHGLGVEPIDLTAVGCDFFVAGCHKWLFGPRGTGVIWGTSAAWERMQPTIPTFEIQALGAWMQGKNAATHVPPAYLATPGGFHSFEHRWALDAAFNLHQQLGPDRVWERIAQLSTQLKEGLTAIPKVTLLTPMDSKLSAGIVCFDIAGYTPHSIVEHLLNKKIIASTTPYQQTLARFSPGLLNSPADIEATLRAVRQLAGSAA